MSALSTGVFGESGKVFLQTSRRWKTQNPLKIRVRHMITGKWRGDDHQLPLGEQQNVHPAPEAFRDVKAPGTGHLPPGRRGVA